MKPLYEHDCSGCVFLGSYACSDLYFCKQGGLPTVLARIGDADSEYISGLALAMADPRLAEAKRRAIEKGLMKGT